MDTFDLLERFGIAVAVGFLIGIERGWRARDQTAGSRVAGVRTYTLISLLGAMWAALVPAAGPWPLAAGGVALGGALAFFQWREAQAKGEFSVTGVVAGLIAYALGAFALLGDTAVAAAAGVAVVLILLSRERLHDLLKKITWPELRSAAILLAMTFLALPVLPDRTIDPWQAINPHAIWLMTVLMAAISYAGYIVVRLEAGGRALIHGAMAGALISSTMVTLLNARLAAKSKANVTAATIAVCLAWIVSLTRMTAVAAVVNISLLPALAAPMAAAAVVIGIAALLVARHGAAGTVAKVEFGNPFDLLPMLGLALLLAAIMFAVKLLNDAFGSGGVLPLAAISGFADVDPVTISVARMARSVLAPETAVHAILLAAAANMITKVATAVVVGGPGFGLRLAGAGLAAILAGGAVAILV